VPREDHPLQTTSKRCGRVEHRQNNFVFYPRSVFCLLDRLGKSKKFSLASNSDPQTDAGKHSVTEALASFLLLTIEQKDAYSLLPSASASPPEASENSVVLILLEVSVHACPQPTRTCHATSKRKRIRAGALTLATCVALADEVFAAPTDPWTQAVQALQTAFTGPIATGLALVAIVVGGLMFAFGEGGRQAHPGRSGLWRPEVAVGGPVNFMSWLFP